MSISDHLAALNWDRNQKRKYRLASLNLQVRQAVYAFNGDVYIGLNAYTLSHNQINYQNEVLINLASNEYFSAVDKKAFKTTLITPEFKDYKNGKLKMISFFLPKSTWINGTVYGRK